MAHDHSSHVDFIAAALVALGIKDDVDDAPSTSGTAGVNLNSAGRTPSADFASMLGTFQVSLTSRSDNAYESDDSSDEEDVEEDDDSGATHAAHGEECDSGGDSQNGIDPILVSDCEEAVEEGDSRSVPDNRDDPIVITDGEEGDSDGDLHNDLEESAEPRQETPILNEGEIRTSHGNEGSVEPRQGTPLQNGEELHPALNLEESISQQRQEAEAHAEIRQRVKEYMEKEAEPDQAKAIMAVKRKIKDEQMEDFPSSKRYLMTLAEATEV
jgi:hypothetical protein